MRARMLETLRRILASRKNQHAFVGLGLVLAVPVGRHMGIELDPAEAREMMMAAVSLAGFLIAGVAIEDHGRHSGAPREESAPPSV